VACMADFHFASSADVDVCKADLVVCKADYKRILQVPYTCQPLLPQLSFDVATDQVLPEI
jgi:hypothetical protein